MFTPTFSIGDRLAAFASGKIESESKSAKRDMARRQAAFLASQTFPNDRFIRQPRREEQPMPEFTPERNRKMLALAYSMGPKPIIQPRKPSRREAIINRRIAEKDLRKTVLADHPLGMRLPADTSLGHKTVNVRGRRCKVAVDHLASNVLAAALRQNLPQDLSPNAVAERKSRGLTAFGRSKAAA